MRFTRSQMLLWSTILLLLLSGCGSTAAQPSPTHAGITPIPTNTPLPFLPQDHDPFQATFIESASFTACPTSSRPTDQCFKVVGWGTSIPYGPITFSSFDINFIAPGRVPIVRTYDHDPGYCEPTTRQGSIVIGKDTFTFTASGTWCWSLVHFVYQVTGGTGTYKHARGTGSISISYSATTFQVLEYWTGTLTP